MKKQTKRKRKFIKFSTNLYQLSIIFLFFLISFSVAINFQTSTILKPFLATILISSIFLALLFKSKIVFPLNPLSIAVIAFFLWNLVSITFSNYFYDNLLQINSIFIGILLFFSILSIQNWKIEFFLKALLIIGFLQALYAIFQRSGISPFAWDVAAKNRQLFEFGNLDNFRIYGTFGHANYLGSFLAFLFPTIFYFLLHKNRNFWFYFSLISLPIILTALFFTLSRGGWIAAFVGSIIFIAFSLIYSPKKISRSIKIGGILGIFLFILLLSLFMPKIFLERLSSLTNLERAIDLGRKNIWTGTWRMFLEKPIFGWGTGTFAQIFPKFRPTDYKSFAENIVQHAHNEYLEILAELGIIGLLLFLFVIGSFVYNFIRQRKNFPLIAIFAGMGGLLLQNLVSVTLRTPTINLLFWGALACSVKSKENKFWNPQKSKWIVFSIILIVSLFFTIFNFKNSISDYYLKQGIENSLQADRWRGKNSKKYLEHHIKKAENLLKKSIKYNKNNYLAHYQLGIIYLDAERGDKAAETYQKLLEISPYYPETRKNLGIAYSLMNQPDKAIGHLKKSLETIEDADTYFALGRLYQSKTLPDSALHYYNQFVPLAKEELERVQNLEAYPIYKERKINKISYQLEYINQIKESLR